MNAVALSAPCVNVVLHDVADATWDACRRVIDAVYAVAPLPLTLLTVPRYRGRLPSWRFEAALAERVAAGDEIALHGYTHADDQPLHGWQDRLLRRWYTDGEGEFSRLTRAEARRRIAAGLSWFAGHGWPVSGFVAPAWLLSTGTWEALRGLPLSYTSTLRYVYDLDPHRAGDHYTQLPRFASQSLVYSTRRAWRRVASVQWNGMLATANRNVPLLRLELHPRDADFSGVRQSWQHILRRALETRTPVTTAEFVRRWRETS